MKKNRYPVICALFFIIVLLIGCVNKNKKDADDKIEEFNLSKGACINENTGYSILNFNNDTEIISSKNYVTNYNVRSNNYLFIKDSKFYIKADNSYVELNGENIQNPQFSKDGQYLFFFTNDDYLIPNIYSIKENKYIDLKLPSVISGTYSCWLNDNTLAYYGFNYNDNKSGIFTYNIDTKEENLKYEVSGGYISFIKSISNGIVFFIKKYDNTTELIFLENQGVFSTVSEDISEIYDLEYLDGDFYLLGKLKNDVYSLFKITNDEQRRLIYNFPKYIDFEKGLSITDKNEILFIGSDGASSDNKLYKYNNDTISIENSEFNDYIFIKVN